MLTKAKSLYLRWEIWTVKYGSMLRSWRGSEILKIWEECSVRIIKWKLKYCKLMKSRQELERTRVLWVTELVRRNSSIYFDLQEIICGYVIIERKEGYGISLYSKVEWYEWTQWDLKMFEGRMEDKRKRLKTLHLEFQDNVGIQKGWMLKEWWEECV